jgi:hypothetical protein
VNEKLLHLSHLLSIGSPRDTYRQGVLQEEDLTLFNGAHLTLGRMWISGSKSRASYMQFHKDPLMLIDDFLSHLGTRSAETLRAHRADVGRFLAFLEATNTILEAISASTIEQYMQHLDATSKTGRPMSAASIGRRLAVISS